VFTPSSNLPLQTSEQYINCFSAVIVGINYSEDTLILITLEAHLFQKTEYFSFTMTFRFVNQFSHHTLVTFLLDLVFFGKS
jgi:hypothetical protein